MKQVFYELTHIKRVNGKDIAHYQFWTKPDKSNALKFKTNFNSSEDEKRKIITQMTGLEKFVLIYVPAKTRVVK